MFYGVWSSSEERLNYSTHKMMCFAKTSSNSSSLVLIVPSRRLYAYTDANGKTKPGMVRPLDTTECAAVDLEVWDVPIENFGKFMLQVPAPLGIGTVDLEDGSQVKGFICEAWVGEAATAGQPNIVDITHLGSWLKFIEIPQQQT